jgi:hypothetical protein
VSVVVLAYLLERMLAGVGAGPGNATLLTLAFISGVVPETVLVRISELARGSARTNEGRAAIQRAARTYETDPLTQLEGIDIYDRARLLDEGVTNVEALAHHDLVDLLLRTRIPAARLVDWVDQAILYLHSTGRCTVGQPAAGAVDVPRTVREVLHDIGIRTATELERAHEAAAARGPADENRFLSAAGVEADGLPVLRVILDAVHDEHWMHSLRRWHGEPAVPSLLRVPEDLAALLEPASALLDANVLTDSPGASAENGGRGTEPV